MSADVFVSYSRSDSAFVESLAESMRQRGKVPWLDIEGIADGEVFPQALREAIEATDAFVFVISPPAAASDFCKQEVEHALACGKRIVPLLHRAVPDRDLPKGVRDRQWITAGAEIDEDAADRLVRALDADLEHTRTHTRLLIRAGEWESRGRDSSALARGNELRESEAWLTAAQGRDPAPTERHAAWIGAGRGAATRRQRRLAAGSVVFGAVAAALLVFALFARSAAVDARAVAQSRALGTAADQQIDLDPQLSLLLANAALRSAGTPEARLAAQQALDETTLRAQLPSVGLRGCPANRLVLLDGGRQAATTTCAGDVVVQDLARGRVVRRVHVGRLARFLTVSPTERTIAVSTEPSGVQLVDVRSGRVRARLLSKFKHVGPVAYDPSGRRLAIADRTGVAIYDLRTRRAQRIPRRAASWYVVAWAGDSRLLAGASGASPGQVGLPNGLYEFDLRHPSRPPRRLITPSTSDDDTSVDAIAVAADGETIYAGGRSRRNGSAYATVWRVNAASGKVAWRARFGGDSFASAVAVSADGRSVAVGLQSGASAVLQADSGAVVVNHAGTSTGVAGIGFQRNGASVVTSSTDGVVRIWSASGSERLRRQIPGATRVVFRGSTLMSVGSELNDLDPATGATVATHPGFTAGDTVNPGGRTVTRFAQRPDLRYNVTIGDTTSGRTLRRSALPSTLANVNVSRSARLQLVTTYPPNYYDRAPAEIVNLATGATQQVQPYVLDCSVADDAFSHDDRRLALADQCGAITIVDVASGRLLRQLRVTERTLALEWAPDGRTFAATTVSGHVVVVTAATGRVRILSRHTKVVNEAHYSADGRWLVSASADGTVNQWDTRTWRLTRRHRIGGNVVSVAISPDSRLLATLDAKSTLRVWDLCEICQNTGALERATARRVLRRLTAIERATFSVG